MFMLGPGSNVRWEKKRGGGCGVRDWERCVGSGSGVWGVLVWGERRPVGERGMETQQCGEFPMKSRGFGLVPTLSPASKFRDLLL